MKEKFTEEEEAEYDRQYDEMRRARLAELFTIDESA